MTHDDALPALPIGEAEVLWHEPDPVMPERPGKIIDASHAFMDAAPLGTRLYSAEQMRAYVRADRAAHAEPVARVGRDGYSVTLEPAAGTLDAVRRLDALPDGALLYAAPPALHEAVDILRKLLTHGWAEDCQECAIGQSSAWADAKALIARVDAARRDGGE